MRTLIYFSSMLLATIAVSAPAGANLIINEVLADPPPGLRGDANGDGVRNSGEDEFIELVNISETPLDISGWTIADRTAARHEFDAGTTLAGYSAILIFGGGTPTGLFGGARTLTASTGLLGLNNSGDQVSLVDAMSVTVSSMSYGAEGGQDQSLTLEPDLHWTDALYVPHKTAVASGGAPFSPGSRSDGAPFAPSGVPEPGTLMLVGLGICLLGLKTPRRIPKPR